MSRAGGGAACRRWVKAGRARRLLLGCLTIVAAVVAGRGPWQSACAADAVAAAAVLRQREEDLRRQYADLERSFLRLADLLSTTDPRRSAALPCKAARKEAAGRPAGSRRWLPWSTR